MKKITVWLLCILFLFTGCSTGSIGKSQDKTVDIGTLIELNNVHPAALYNGNLLYAVNKKNGENTADLSLYTYNINDKKTTGIGMIPSYNTESGDLVIMENRYIYKSVGVVENDDIVNNFYRLDADSSGIQTLSKEKIDPPLVYFDKLNEDEFILHGPRAINDSGRVFEYYIKKYNTKTNTEDGLVKTQYNKDSQTGTMLSDVCVNGDRIMAFMIDGQNGNWQYSVGVYDQTGQQLQTIPIQQMKDFLNLNETNIKTDTVSSFKAFGSYYFFRTLNGRSLLLKYESNKFNEVFRRAEIQNGYSMLENETRTSSVVNNRYVYFYNHIDNCVDIFDIKTEKLHSVQFHLDEQCDTIRQCFMDEQGNLVLNLTEDPYKTKTPLSKLYFVKAADIL